MGFDEIRNMPDHRSVSVTSNRPRVVVIIPAPTPDGPVKGAYAMANMLSAQHDVTLVTLKDGPGAGAVLAPGVTHVSLTHASAGMLGKGYALRRLLSRLRCEGPVVTLSMCFSADLANWLNRDHAFAVASVRGNLFENYRFDYGKAGTALAWLHMHMLGSMQRVIAMNVPMRDQLRPFVRDSKLAIISNFIDEQAVARHRVAAQPPAPFRFVFLGSLTERKCPVLAVRALDMIRRKGVDAALDIVGDGPLLEQVRAEVTRLSLQAHVACHGALTEPLPVVAQAHALVLPSLSEGTPRAALEALHLGLPCVLRDVDGNGELIQEGVNGSTFNDDLDLPDAMQRTMTLVQKLPPTRASLIPAPFRQAHVKDQLIAIMEAAHD